MGKNVYVYMTLTRYIIRVDISKMELEFEVVADFIKQGIPVCMGFFSHNSRVYVLGGEKCNSNSNLLCGSIADLDESYSEKGLSHLMYELKDDKNFYPDFFRQMNAAKVQPKVAIINKKLYVLSSNTPFFDWNGELPYPAFERLDLSDESCYWEKLPEPPYYRDDNDAMRRMARSVSCFFVLDDKIYMKNSHGGSCYNTTDQTWKILESDSVPCPSMSASVAQGIHGVVIALTEKKEVVAYHLDDQHKLKCYQVLQDLSLQIPFPECPTGFIRHMGDNHFCLVISENDSDLCSVFPFNISTFKVTINTSLDDGEVFFKAKLINSQSYCLHPTILSRDNHIIHDILIMSE